MATKVIANETWCESVRADVIAIAQPQSRTGQNLRRTKSRQMGNLTAFFTLRHWFKIIKYFPQASLQTF
jgi:hypothetical protein